MICLRTSILNQKHVEDLRAFVELLHESHLSSDGKDEEIEGIRFIWKSGAYHCDQGISPFTSISFYSKDDLPEAEKIRDISHSCVVQNLSPKYVMEDNPPPKGISNLTDPSAKAPVSDKIGDILRWKLGQCEEGVINIIALCNPLPMNDCEVVNAVCGAPVAMLRLGQDANGNNLIGGGELRRLGKAPFMPEAGFSNDEERLQFVDPFRKMSAVWNFRLGSYSHSKIIPNPNAVLPIPADLGTALDTNGS